jgi:hypothetical protein
MALRLIGIRRHGGAKTSPRERKTFCLDPIARSTKISVAAPGGVGLPHTFEPLIGRAFWEITSLPDERQLALSSHDRVIRED